MSSLKDQLGALVTWMACASLLLWIALTYVWYAWQGVREWRRSQSDAEQRSRDRWYLGDQSARDPMQDDEPTSSAEFLRPLIDPGKTEAVDAVTFGDYRTYNRLKREYVVGNFGADRDTDAVDDRVLYAKHDDYT